jgi:hypothetical protein
MKRIGIATLVVTVVVACAPEDQPTPLEVFFASNPVKVSETAIDARVMTELLRGFEDHRLARSGEHFQRTDLVEEDLPPRKLILAARSGNQWLIVYRHYRVDLHYHMILYALEDGLPELFYSAKGYWGHEPLELFRGAVKAGWFEEDSQL